ncbi:hypothetical protein PRZ48_011297 [Zasmidium cellare]|uniref:Acyltransferase MbtK/IucB-like conserved domain-containing protein n=1 Tax=Zasmidium cellare TaxID=395010 RepID=A0ABR0E5Y7_ZASCE|nr:hypothetical protein PRZ48_011297 [Zasmidium cellare]
MSSLILPATIRLPHPYLTTYRIHEVNNNQAPTRYGTKLLQIRYEPRTSGKTPSQKDARAPSEQLHSNVCFSNPVQDQRDDQLPPESNNFFWGRVRRAPKADFVWNETSAPTIGQVWLIIYALFTLRPELEYFRLGLVGLGRERLAEELKAVHLACQHPVPEGKTNTDPDAFVDELVLLRSTFWQGAGCPFGPRPVWAPDTNQISGRELASFPAHPIDYTASCKFPSERVHAFHPRRPQKPAPGSIIYSRYIPHLDEHFSMYALDYNNDEHLGLFNKWQNDPFVAAGWNETGTLEQHREYLRKLHEDAHTMTVLAKFDDTFFAYYEVYWGKEDHFGVYADAGDFDRGRHSLVGDTRFRGKHRVSAWWSSIIHYLFLDEPRTQSVIGEPKMTNGTVLSYDLMCGFGVMKYVDLTHKRSACMKVGRERFFQLCPLHFDGETNVGGTGIKLFAKL